MGRTTLLLSLIIVCFFMIYFVRILLIHTSTLAHIYTMLGYFNPLLGQTQMLD